MDGDDFIRNLWQTHLKVKEEGYAQVPTSSTRCGHASNRNLATVIGTF